MYRVLSGLLFSFPSSKLPGVCGIKLYPIPKISCHECVSTSARYKWGLIFITWAHGMICPSWNHVLAKTSGISQFLEGRSVQGARGRNMNPHLYLALLPAHSWQDAVEYILYLESSESGFGPITAYLSLIRQHQHRSSEFGWCEKCRKQRKVTPRAGQRRCGGTSCSSSRCIPCNRSVWGWNWKTQGHTPLGAIHFWGVLWWVHFTVCRKREMLHLAC